MTTLAVKILNPKARNILEDLANVGLIEVVPFKSSIAEFQEEMCGVAETHGIRNESDIVGIVAEIRREMRNEYQPPVEK
jgi:predicted transcriptional regulator